MGRADIIAELKEIRNTLACLRADVSSCHARVETTHRDLHDKIEGANNRADRLVDKLITMALVQSGNPREAVAMGRLNTTPTDMTVDSPPVEDEEWFRVP